MYETILAALDSSESARDALAHAIALAESKDATVHVVTVLEVQSNPVGVDVGAVDALHDDANDLLEHSLEEYDAGDVAIETETLEGKPAETLLEYARTVDADLIVAGQKGAGGITGTLVGSTTDRLTRLTDIPLTVVPESEQDSDDTPTSV